ncbi:MAG: hypothetical protein H6601_12415 [Flavobacteriales bacterium]|nr:hypothetical protein [Flavobacteriales bacterium]
MKSNEPVSTKARTAELSKLSTLQQGRGIPFFVAITTVFFLTLSFGLAQQVTGQVFKKTDICSAYFQKVMKDVWSTNLYSCLNDNDEEIFQLKATTTIHGKMNQIQLRIVLPEATYYDQKTKLTFHLNDGSTISFYGWIPGNGVGMRSNQIMFQLDNAVKELNDLAKGFSQVDLRIDESNSIHSSFSQDNQSTWTNSILPCLLKLQQR